MELVSISPLIFVQMFSHIWKSKTEEMDLKRNCSKVGMRRSERVPRVISGVWMICERRVRVFLYPEFVSFSYYRTLCIQQLNVNLCYTIDYSPSHAIFQEMLRNGSTPPSISGVCHVNPATYGPTKALTNSHAKTMSNA